MKAGGKERLKQAIYESTLSTADAVPPFPNGEGLGGATLRVNFYKGRCPKVVGIAIRGKRISNIQGNQPRLATLDSPFQRKGRECVAFRVYRSLLPLEGGRKMPENSIQVTRKQKRETSVCTFSFPAFVISRE